MSYMLFSETWNVFWFVLGAWLYLKTLSKKDPTWFVLCGVSLGVASLFRSISLYFVPLLLLHFWLWGGPRLRSKLTGAAILLVTVAGTIAIQTYNDRLLSYHKVPDDIHAVSRAVCRVGTCRTT